MWPFTKPAEALTEADLLVLVSSGAREGIGLEFKEAFYDQRDPKYPLELLKDVASIANAEGGAIIFGMKEDGDGTALGLVPVADAETQANKLVAVCNAHIDERIPGLRAPRVPITGGSAFVVVIPTSYRRPHMIKHEGATEFWIRHDRQKSRMSLAQIRTAITSTEDLAMKVERFIEERRTIVKQQKRLNSPISLMATPLLLEDGRVDTSSSTVRELLREPPTYRGTSGETISSHDALIRPSLYGVRALEDKYTVVDIFRSGHVEFMPLAQDLIWQQNVNPYRIKPVAVARFIHNFVLFVDTLRRITGIGGPYLFTISLWDCGGFEMLEMPSGRFGEGHRPGKYDDSPHLLLDPIAAGIDDTAHEVTRRLTNRIWNAFHFERCPFFDVEGQFTTEPSRA